jgi:toxin ParE1/3/4
MNIVWSPEATQDLAVLHAYIAEDDPAAAMRTVLRILDIVETALAGNSRMGRPGRVPGTRELVISRSPFIVPYRVERGAIQILRIYHGARRWPESF